MTAGGRGDCALVCFVHSSLPFPSPGRPSRRLVVYSHTRMIWESDAIDV